MRREQVIDEKAALVARELEEWAGAQDILRAGERIVFSMKVEKIPLAVREPVEASGFLAMPAVEFFSFERLIASGMTRENASKISNAVKNDASPSAEDGGTLADFIQKYPTPYELGGRLAGIRSRRAQHMAEFIRSVGIAYGGQ